MKAGVVVMGLWLAAVQTVSFSNCCQGILCSQKDDCPPCGESKEGRACCESESPEAGDPVSDESRVPCVHIEPSSQVAQADGSLKADPPALCLLPGARESDPCFAPTAIQQLAQGVDPPLRPEDPSHLYLLDRALLI